VWDPVRRSRLGVLNGHDQATRTIAFGPDSRVLVSGGRDGSVIVWDVERRALVRRIAGVPETIDAVAVSPDGTLMAAVGTDRQIRIWRIGDGSLVTTLDGYGAYCLTSPSARTGGTWPRPVTTALWWYGIWPAGPKWPG